MLRKSLLNKIFWIKNNKIKFFGFVLFFVIFALTPLQNIHADNSGLQGSIKVCSISLNQDFSLITDKNTIKSFEFSQNLTNKNADILRSKNFDGGNVNEDILKDIEGNDANCFTYKDLNLGTYYYNQVKNDSSFSSFYNNEAGNSSLNSVNFHKHNMDNSSLGFVTLTEENANRTIIILNIYSKNIVKNSQDLVLSMGQKDNVEITYLNDPHSQISLRTSFNEESFSRTKKDTPLEKIKIFSRTFEKKGIIAIENPPLDPSAPNSRPVITLTDGDLSLNVGDTYNEPGYTALDNEDGNITSNVIVSGSVNTSVAGTYTLTYDVSDSGVATAIQQTRIITVNAVSSPNSRPVITLTGDSSTTITQGSTYTDQGATASDLEDGNITANIVTTGLPINTSVLGTYTIRYNVSDSQSLSAIEVTRSVTVQATPPVPPTPPTPPTPPGSPGGCVGCGGGPLDIRITIFNEKVVKINNNTALVTWNTNLPATSKVAYGLNSFKNKTIDKNKEDYGYGNTTPEFTALTQSHTMLITNLLSGVKYYFRPNSDNSNSERIAGIELELPLAPVAGQCNYLLEYLQIGANNNPQEVTKLQKFLKDYEEFKDLEITGIFDQKTFDAVSQFQTKYNSDILVPWKHNEPTGFVYITTKKKINEIYCERTLPLSDAEKEEIRRFTEEKEKVIQEAEKEGLDIGQIIGKTEEGTKETSLAQAEVQTSTTTPSAVITGARNLVAGVAKISGQVVDSLGQAAEDIAKGVYKGIDLIANGFLKLFGSSSDGK